MAVENSSSEYILRVVASQRDYFRSGATLDVKFRKEMLQRLLDSLHKWEKPLAEALWNDLHKSYEEAYMTEFSIIYGEIKNHLKNISSNIAINLVRSQTLLQLPFKTQKQQLKTIWVSFQAWFQCLVTQESVS